MNNMLEELALSTIIVVFFFAVYYLYLFRCFRDTGCFQPQGNKLYGVQIRPLNRKSEHPKQSATKCHKALFCAAVSTQTLFTFLYRPKWHSAPFRALVKTQQSTTIQTTSATKTWRLTCLITGLN